MDSLRKRKDKKQTLRQSVGKTLEVVESDKVIKTDSVENKRRRTIILTKQNNSWGFTLQTYGIQHSRDKALEDLTYVDYVEFGGAGFYAGMRPGDVILSINGASVENLSHKDLVKFIKRCDNTMRMVVLFEDCVRKVDLHLRFLKLKAVLQDKVFEYRALEAQEKRLMQGLSPFETRSLCPSIDSVTTASSDDSNIDSDTCTESLEFKHLDLSDRSSLLNFYMDEDDVNHSSHEEAVDADDSLDDFAAYRARSVSCTSYYPRKHKSSPSAEWAAGHGASMVINAMVHSSENNTSAIIIPKDAGGGNTKYVCGEMSAHSSCDQHCRTARMTPCSRINSIDSIDSLENDQSLLDSGFADNESSVDCSSPVEGCMNDLTFKDGVVADDSASSLSVKCKKTLNNNQKVQSSGESPLGIGPCDIPTKPYGEQNSTMLVSNLLKPKGYEPDIQKNSIELEDISLQVSDKDDEGPVSLCEFIRLHGTEGLDNVNEEEESTDL